MRAPSRQFPGISAHRFRQDRNLRDHLGACTPRQGPQRWVVGQEVGSESRTPMLGARSYNYLSYRSHHEPPCGWRIVQPRSQRLADSMPKQTPQPYANPLRSRIASPRASSLIYLDFTAVLRCRIASFALDLPFVSRSNLARSTAAPPSPFPTALANQARACLALPTSL